jgi:hypothetical protein
MRYPVINGNGSLCDKCKKPLRPQYAVKAKFYKKIENDGTGRYETVKGSRRDLCDDCLKKVLEFIDS